LEKQSSILNTQKFVYLNGIVSVFPNLDYLNLEGSWGDLSASYFIEAVRESAGKRLMIVTESTIFADKTTTARDLQKRKAQNDSWNFDKYKEPKFVPC
jgi:hypothetical protein